ELLNQLAQDFLRARRNWPNRGADVVQAVDAVEQIVFKRDLLDLLEVVLERRFSKKLINVLKCAGGISRQPVEVNEVHSVAESARERILNANVREAHNVRRLKPDVAAALEALELDDVHFLLIDSPECFVFAPEFFETRQDLRDVAHADDDLRLALKQHFGHLQLAQPGAISVEHDRSIHRIEEAI